MVDTQEEISMDIKETDSSASRGLKFVLKKFLVKLKLVDAEEKMLEGELRDLDTNIKKRKMKNIISKF